MSTLCRTEQLLLQKKRKLDQSIGSGESSGDHGQALEKNIHHNVKKLVTNLPCGTNFTDIISDSSDEQIIPNSFTSTTGESTSIEGNHEEQSNSYSAPSTVDLVSPSVVMDRSVHDGSNLWSQQDMASRNQPLEDPTDEADGSDFSDAEEESSVTIRRRVFSLLYLDDEYPPRPVVPIGPGFQAEIPVWVGKRTKNNYNTLESTEYTGTRVWPVEDGINETLLGSNGQEGTSFALVSHQDQLTTSKVMREHWAPSIRSQVQLRPRRLIWLDPYPHMKKDQSQAQPDSLVVQEYTIHRDYP